MTPAEPDPPESPYRIARSNAHPDALPLVVEAQQEPDPERLCAWLRANATWAQGALTRVGAVLFRGFDVADASTFERVARAIDGELKNEYLGTSPRNALTSHVFTASELPPYYPIPQHCEMSFTKTPPRRLFFACFVAPAPGSGETPLADFRRVLRDLDPGVRKRFEQKGLRIVRNYRGPGDGSRFDLWQLKRWDEMFLTTDRQAIEEKCRAEGFEPIWTDGGGLRIVSTQPVVRIHPTSGEEVWHNHLTTFHPSQAVGEYRRIHRLRPGPRSLFFWQLARVLGALQRRKPSDDLAMQCTHLDGSAIADADVEAVRDVIWRHMVITPWRRGDVVAIDNYAVSHGRLPYRGPRAIAVAWA